MAENAGLSPGQNGGGSALDATQIGEFEVLNRLRRGGRGSSFKARHVRTGRLVTLTFFPLGLSDDEAAVHRFLREAHAAAALTHPNLVQGIDVGFDGGLYYAVSEFVDGTNVLDLVRREGRLEEKRALAVVGAVALALEHAGKQGILHGDIRPEMILIGPDESVRLAGLGLPPPPAVPPQTGRPAARLPFGGLVRPAAEPAPHFYRAPEQAQDEAATDTRADIYALGATLSHMLTGEPPSDGAVAALAQPPPPDEAEAGPQLSRAARELVQRMMAPDRQDRPQSPTELLQEISDALLGKIRLRIKPPAPPPKEPRRATHRRIPTLPLVIGGLALVAGVALYFAVLGKGGASAYPEQPRTAVPPPPQTDPTLEARKTEAAARESWRLISHFASEGLSATRARDLLRRLDAYEQRYGATRFRVEEGEQIAALRARARRAVEGWLDLFDGKSLAGWTPQGPNSAWRVEEGGVLANPRKGPDICTERYFEDLELRLEYRIDKGSDSGVYLRGRKEVQIRDDFGKPDRTEEACGGVYRKVAPSVNACKPAGEWSTLDITIVGRKVTVVHNGKTVVDGEQINGVTPQAIQGDEDAAGPILLQGTCGPVRFRNIRIRQIRR